MPVMTSRETVIRTICFNYPERSARDFPNGWGTDFASVNMEPSPDDFPPRGLDEWGTFWMNAGTTMLGKSSMI